mmetsp:Transcript_134016/g.334503  ORF Transcript_134016/g.334503 Transcript_134016/m.334503 type:complete len:204 (-) Transcript_134016:560-1171(-)
MSCSTAYFLMCATVSDCSSDMECPIAEVPKEFFFEVSFCEEKSDELEKELLPSLPVVPVLSLSSPQLKSGELASFSCACSSILFFSRWLSMEENMAGSPYTVQMPLGRTNLAPRMSRVSCVRSSCRVETSLASKSMQRIALLSVSATNAVPASAHTTMPIGLWNLASWSEPSVSPASPTRPAKSSTLWLPCSVKASAATRQMQ